MIAAAILLPIGASAIYYNGTTTASTSSSTVPQQIEATSAAAPAAGQAPESADLTTYVTVALGKTITVTTAKASVTPAPVAPESQEAPEAIPASADLTTYVTVKLGKTITVTTPKSEATGVFVVNGANTVGSVGKIAALAGAGAAALLL